MNIIESKGHYISGKWINGKGPKFNSCGPIEDSFIFIGNNATTNECNEAIEAASKAFKLWSSFSHSDRIAFLRAFVEILKIKKNKISERIALEIGKPLWEALTEVNAMIGKLEPTEHSYLERNKDISRTLPNGISWTRFKPHGVVAVIGPYNFPGHMPNGHIMPALLAGNTIVFKPSEKAPAVAEMIIECWEEAGIPPGTLNLLQGDSSVGKYLCQNKKVNGIFFTGSRKVGERIRKSLSVDQICALEMGGNSPLIVWDTSEINGAILATIQSAFVTAGQRCSAARRLIIPKNDFGQFFLSKLVEISNKIKVGPFYEIPEPFMGPLRNSKEVDDLIKKQAHLISQGATPLLKCKRLQTGKSFVSPGIIDVTNVKNRDDDEIIGPFLQVIRVNNFEEALIEANNSKYGLAAGLISEEVELYNVFQKIVKAGILNWNQQLTGASAWAPFGGSKESGNFRPSGYLASDYCVYSTGSIEVEKLNFPSDLPPGLVFEASTNPQGKVLV